jgi:phosphopantothenoylcysteine synthetase/decarboxylase
VTGGPTPVPIDAVRRLVNLLCGRLASAIAAELLLRGADPELLLGEGSAPPPPWLPHEWLPSYDSYQQRVLAAVADGVVADGAVTDGAVADSAFTDGAAAAGDSRTTVAQASSGQGSGAAASGPEGGLSAADTTAEPPPERPGTEAARGAAAGGARLPLSAAILSAAVADYRPRQVHPGKLASGQPRLSLDLEPTAKVIDLLRQAAPTLPMVTFKVLQGASEQELLAEARRRLERFQLVVANHAEEVSGLEQCAWLVSSAGVSRHQGKAAIAAAIVDWLEAHLAPPGSGRS